MRTAHAGTVTGLLPSATLLAACAGTTDDGRTMYFALSIWDPHNVFWDKAELFKR